MGVLVRQTCGENGLLCRRDVIRNSSSPHVMFGAAVNHRGEGGVALYVS